MPQFFISNRKNKKYDVITPKGKRISFGNSLYSQYKDSTGIGAFSYLDHKDPERRRLYLARAKGIRDKEGNLTYLNPESPNYYAVKYLW